MSEPQTPPLSYRLRALREELLADGSGEVATYIPELGRADPGRFGLALATADGHVHGSDDTDVPFTIQSVSKPFTYALALADRGVDEVLRHVGTEPTGDAFNAVTLEEGTGRPLNPMVNAGAIVTSSLVDGANAEQRTERIVAGLSAFAGRPLAVDASVRESEWRTSDRNRAIAYLMRGAASLHVDVEEALEAYITQCSLLVTARDLAVMGATLAAGGENPLTGERVLDPHLVAPTLTVMATCGMYDAAGTWMYRVGLPAKSGVAGGLVAILPNQLGLAAWSPPLDAHGNTVRGVRAMESLSTSLDLHLYTPTGHLPNPVRRTTTGAVVHSLAGRSAHNTRLLSEHGSAIGLVELQGALTFLAAPAVAAAVTEAGAQQSDRPGTARRWLVLDTRRVSYVHPGALRILNDALDLASEAGLDITVVTRETSDVSPEHPQWRPRSSTDMDAALQRCEDALLEDLPEAVPPDEAYVPLEDHVVLRDLSPVQVAVVRPLLRRRPMRVGEACDPARRGLTWVTSGRLDVEVSTGGGRGWRRVDGIGAGGMLDESTLLERGEGRVRATAVVPSVVQDLEESALAQLSSDHPDVTEAILRSVGTKLLARQRETQRIVESLSEA